VVADGGLSLRRVADRGRVVADGGLSLWWVADGAFFAVASGGPRPGGGRRPVS
jgi:hypothetical protein